MDNNLVVLVFEEEPFEFDKVMSVSSTKAEGFLETVQEWQENGLVEIEDAVIALRGVGTDIKIKQTESLTGKYALGGSGIGLLAGLLLGGPIGGLIGGAAIGAISGKMKDFGIDDKFIKEISAGLVPNSSALFLLGRSTDPEKFLEQVRPYKAFVATTTLGDEQEKALKKALEREE
jgi:uncharacterized membrane protein